MNHNNNSGYFSENSASENEDDDLNAIEEYSEIYTPPIEAVILLLDVDSFEVQVHGLDQGCRPEDLRDKPFVVENEFGVLTAVNYPAKKDGIKRTKDFNGRNVDLTCPNVTVLQIPNHYEKPNSLIAKRASDKIFDCLKKSVHNLVTGPNLPIVEKASKDEFYIDVTDEVHFRVNQNKFGSLVPTPSVVTIIKDKCHNEAPSHKATGKRFRYRTLKVVDDPTKRETRHETEALLIHGAAIAYQILSDIQNHTKFICSVGVSSNKLLAKIGCGRNKPNSITILPQASLPRVSKTVLIEDIPELGGKLGKDIKDKFKIKTMCQLSYIDRIKLQKFCGGEKGIKFHQLAIGYDPTKVVETSLCKSMKCGISFNFRTRTMSNVSAFERHLESRFMEMREHLAYECLKHGPDRFPKSFKLEVKTRKRGFYSVFGETIDTSTVEGLNPESVPPSLLNDDVFNCCPMFSLSWATLYQNFCDSLTRNCSISIYDPNMTKSKEAVRKVSEINLYANFIVD